MVSNAWIVSVPVRVARDQDDYGERLGGSATLTHAGETVGLDVHSVVTTTSLDDRQRHRRRTSATTTEASANRRSKPSRNSAADRTSNERKT